MPTTASMAFRIGGELEVTRLGVGEIGLAGIAPAIANAVFHETGRRIRSLPITIDRLLQP
jgi:CO/xanthine dehydrogenase Mo-binding subunit